MPAVERRRSAWGTIIVVVTLGIVIVFVIGLIAQSQQKNSPTTISAAATATDAPSTRLYLGQFEKSAVETFGTPTFVLSATPGAVNGYAVCLTNPQLDMWKVGTDATTDRIDLIAPRDGCTDPSLDWRSMGQGVLPPDAKLVKDETQDGGPVEILHSDWLKARLGCGTIQIRGDDATNEWTAVVDCITP